MGGFGAFGNPSSFHNPWVRKIRKSLHPVILDNIFREHLEETGLKFEQDIDRMMIRTTHQTVGRESWHRDESKYAKPGDTIFGGWVNFDAFPHYLSACPGTHMEADAQRKNTRHSSLTRPSSSISFSPALVSISPSLPMQAAVLPHQWAHILSRRGPTVASHLVYASSRS